MKKNIALLSTTLLLSLTALAGCGQDNRKAVTMWATFNTNYQAIIEKAIKNFEAANPEWRIDYVKQNGSYNDLKDMVVKGVPAGNYPDLVVAYPDSVADFLYTGKALDITPYMTNEEYGWTKEDFDDIPTAYIEEGQNYMIEGTFSLPICKSTEAMYYNKAIIGVDLSEYDAEINGGEAIDEDYINSLTWDELFDHLCPAIVAWNNDQPDAKKLIDTSEGSKGAEWKDNWAVVGYDSDDNLFITLAEQYGYGYTSVDKQTGNGSIDFVNDGMKGLMKKFNDAYKNHYFTTKNIIGKNVNYLSTVGAMLFSIGSTGGVGYQFSTSNPLDVGVARIPQATTDEDDAKIINQGPSIAFMKRDVETAAYAEHVWKFYKELTTTKIATEWATTTGYTPIRRSVTETADYQKYMDESLSELKTASRLTARNAKYAASVGDYLFSSPVFLGSSKARTAVGALAGACIKDDNIDANIDKLFNEAYNNAI